MSLPENHLDLVVATDSVDPMRQAPLRVRILAVVALPLLFLVSFSLAYTSALHDPSPHHLALVIAGPDDATRQLERAIDDRAAAGFTIARTTDVEGAGEDVAAREAVGAIVLDGANVTAIVATAGGSLAAFTVQDVAAQAAAQSGGTLTVTDVASTTDEDPNGTALFFFLIVCTIGGYLSVTVLTQTLPKARTRTMLATALGAAVLAPTIGFAMMTPFVGDFGAPFHVIAGVLGVAMLYTLTVGLLSTLFTKLLGQGAVFPAVILIMALNFPSAGGASPESMLPGFWQVIHNGWFGSAALEAMRSILFFDGHQAGRWMLQLLVWAAGALLLVAVAAFLAKRRAPAPPSETVERLHTDGLAESEGDDPAALGSRRRRELVSSRHD